MSLQPWDAYSIYHSLKLHFTSDSYDAIRYNYKTSVKVKSFEERRDKYSFAKLARKYPQREKLTDFILANCAASPNSQFWIGDIVSDAGEDIYLDWCKKRDGIYYHFSSDVDKLVEYCILHGLKFDDLLINSSPYPKIISIFLSGEISLETLTLIDILTDFMAHSRVTEPIIWPDLSRKVRKYRVFWKWVDQNRVKQILFSAFTPVQNCGTIQPHTTNTTTHAHICHSQT